MLALIYSNLSAGELLAEPVALREVAGFFGYFMMYHEYDKTT